MKARTWIVACLALFALSYNAAPSIERRLMSEEGLRLKLYRGPGGEWLVGYGRNVSAVGVSASEAALLLGNDIEAATRRLDERAPWWRGLDVCRREALIDLSFLLGYRLFDFRTMLGHLKAGRYESAGKALNNSRLPRQIGKRAKLLARQLADAKGC